MNIEDKIILWMLAPALLIIAVVVAPGLMLSDAINRGTAQRFDAIEGLEQLDYQ